MAQIRTCSARTLPVRKAAPLRQYNGPIKLNHGAKEAREHGTIAVAENYPELRSSDVFAELQRGIRDAEEHLQAARRLYNSNVTAYNTAIAMFPAKLLAGSRRPKEFFAADASKLEDV